MTKPVTHQVVVRRTNGRLLKKLPASSRYAAKQISRKAEAKYPAASYYVEIETVPPTGHTSRKLVG